VTFSSAEESASFVSMVFQANHTNRRIDKVLAWNGVLLDKILVSHPDKKFPAFYGRRQFITVFTRAHHSSLDIFILADT